MIETLFLMINAEYNLLTTLAPLPVWLAMPTGICGALGFSGEVLPVPGTEPAFGL